MNALDEIISILTDVDVVVFKSYLKARNKRKDTVNIQLFELIKTDDIEGIKKLYPVENKDAYHALRKRLYDVLVDFMANRSFENDTSAAYEVLRLVVVSRIFLEHQLTKTAFKCLAKAAAKAQQEEHFGLLNEIYQTQIQYSHLNKDSSLDLLITQFKANRERLGKEEQLNMAYAVIRKELEEIYHEGKIIDFQLLIKNTIASFGISLQEILTFKSLYQMLFIANEYASILNDFSTIESFVLHSYTMIAHEEETSEKHLYYRIYILYLMANMHFRNYRFDISKSYLVKMKDQMLRQDKHYYNRFCLRYFIVASLNENYSGNPSHAIAIAAQALKDNPKAIVEDRNDLRLMLVMLYVQQEEYQKGYKEMREFSHTDSWYEKKMGMDWTIKKNLMEIIVHAQLEHTELSLARLKSFRRRYKTYLVDVNEMRVLLYVQLLERYINKPQSCTSENYKTAFDQLLKRKQAAHADIFIISFMGWMWGIIQHKKTYAATLELLDDYFKPSHSA